MPVAVSVNFPAEKKPFCRGRLLHVDEDATLSVLRVALGGSESLNPTLRRDLTKQERPAPCLFSHHRRQRSSRARAEEARDSGLELVTCTYVTPTVDVQHTRAAWATLATTFFWQRGYRYMHQRLALGQSYCSLFLKGWHTGCTCKKISAKKKPTARP